MKRLPLICAAAALAIAGAGPLVIATAMPASAQWDRDRGDRDWDRDRGDRDRGDRDRDRGDRDWDRRDRDRDRDWRDRDRDWDRRGRRDRDCYTITTRERDRDGDLRIIRREVCRR